VKPDVVVANGAGTALNAILAASLTGVRHRILWIHAAADLSRRHPLRKLAERASIPFSSVFLGVTEAQIPFMTLNRGYPAERIRIVRSGVDVKRSHSQDHCEGLHSDLEIQQFRPVVAMVARLHPDKDHTTFLRAARIVLDRLPKTQFLVIGDGRRRGELESLCRTLGIADNVLFTGARSDIDRLLPAIDIHVLSSHTEALPLAVLEGMACGKPVICTNVGGTSQIVEDGVSGFMVPPRDPAQLADRVITLLTRRDLAQQMGEAGKRRVESEFNLPGSVAAIEKFIEQLVREEQSPRSIES
jgi:glycosyltransferase involved in cell wall biosynthesis